MKRVIMHSLSLFLCISLAVVTLHLPIDIKADTASSLQNDIAKLQAESAKLEAEIKRLKNEKNDQSAVLEAVRKKISNTQAQVLRCNQEITSINTKISENKALINTKNQEIEDNKLSFKKRLRAIHMSNTGSDLQVILGADDFADFLQLAQLTSSVSARDKRLIEDLISAIKELEEKNTENEKLLQGQVEIRKTVLEAQKQLEEEENEAEKIYNQISSQQSSAEKDNAAVEATIKEKTAYLNNILSGGKEHDSFVNTNTGFIWPVPSCRNITSYYGPRWGTTHKGIDISGGGIYGKPIVAVTDGVVYRTYNSCPHKTRSSRCRCGSGWGNHVAINHGNIDGVVYKAMYAHMDSIAAYNGQKVKKGQVIGYVGTTGDSTGYHLHFGLMKNDVWTNPMPYLRNVK